MFMGSNESIEPTITGALRKVASPDFPVSLGALLPLKMLINGRFWDFFSFPTVHEFDLFPVYR